MKHIVIGQRTAVLISALSMCVSHLLPSSCGARVLFVGALKLGSRCPPGNSLSVKNTGIPWETLGWEKDVDISVRSVMFPQQCWWHFSLLGEVAYQENGFVFVLCKLVQSRTIFATPLGAKLQRGLVNWKLVWEKVIRIMTRSKLWPIENIFGEVGDA